MVLVLFSVTFFTETNQKRHKESLSFIRAISATSIAVSLPAAPLQSHRTQCECWRVVYTVANHGWYHILLKGRYFIWFIFWSKLPNTFWYRRHRRHNELLFHYPREHKFDIKCLQLLIAEILSCFIVSVNNASYAGTKANYPTFLPWEANCSTIFQPPAYFVIFSDEFKFTYKTVRSHKPNILQWLLFPWCS
jgi:hypothetical protein